MKIIYDKRFENSFVNIWEYIAKDSKTRANEFKSQLKAKINQLPQFPYKFRKSIYFNDENIRDLIFKGYTIPYKVETRNDRIVILGIKKFTKEL